MIFDTSLSSSDDPSYFRIRQRGIPVADRTARIMRNRPAQSWIRAITTRNQYPSQATVAAVLVLAQRLTKSAKRAQFPDICYILLASCYCFLKLKRAHSNQAECTRGRTNAYCAVKHE